MKEINMRYLIILALLLVSFGLFGQNQIVKKVSDLNKVDLGKPIVIEGPEDPEEYSIHYEKIHKAWAIRIEEKRKKSKDKK